jgi:hypothetical protein
VSNALADLAAEPRVAAAVDEARVMVDRLLGHRMLRRSSALVAAESALRGARASAALDGSSYPLDALRGGDVPADPVLQGALRLSLEVGGLVDVLGRAPRQVLARLHAVAAGDSIVPDRVGRPRGEREPLVDPLGLGDPPGPAAVAARLDALSELLAAKGGAPAIVVAAVAHGEVLALRPFGWGNGLVARSLERLVLIGRGLDPKAVSAPEVGHHELASEYGERAAGYVAGTAEGVIGWVVHCAAAVRLGAREGVAMCEALQRG